MNIAETSCCHCENNCLVPEYRSDGISFDNICSVYNHELTLETVFNEIDCEFFERIK